MHQFSALFADFNYQQMLASGVIGAGIALVIGVFAQIGKNRKLHAEAKQAAAQPEEDEPGWKKAGEKTEPEEPMPPLAGALFFILGMALVIGGIIWRTYS
jgi:hypothetical protein